VGYREGEKPPLQVGHLHFDVLGFTIVRVLRR